MKIVSVLFDEDRKVGGLECKDKSRTQQHLANECDINEIVRRYEKSGAVTHVMERSAQFGDFSQVPDYQEAVNFIRRADDLFMALPVDVRERFENDPGQLLAFLGDARNREEAAKLGFVRPEEPKGDKGPNNAGSAATGDSGASGGASSAA